MNLNNALSITAIIVAAIVGFPSFIEIIYNSFKNFKINSIWKKITKTLELQELINPWNHYKDQDERWKDYVFILINQKIIYFTSWEILDGFKNLNDLKKDLINLKKQLENHNIFTILKINYKWKLIYDKLQYCSKFLFDNEIIVKDTNAYSYLYNKLLFSHPFQIERTSISLSDELDEIKLWKYKSVTFSDAQEKVHFDRQLIKTFFNKKIKSDIKNNSFVFNLRFKKNNSVNIKEETLKKNNLNFYPGNELSFSLFFDDKSNLIQIKTIFEWDPLFCLYSPKYKIIDVALCLHIIKKIFKINYINSFIKNKDILNKMNELEKTQFKENYV